MYDRILLSVDLHEPKSWEKALPTAKALAKSFGSELHLLTIVPELPAEVAEAFISEEDRETLVQRANAGIEKFAAEHGNGLKAVPHIAMGSVYQEICRKADEIDADLIIMGSHRPQMSDFLLGPNAARVVRHSNRSVMVVRD